MPPSSTKTYNCKVAIKFERLDIKQSFRAGFLDKIEKINYERYVM